jgi:hypothetical protein
MAQTRYTGEDIAIDLILKNYDGSVIDPTTLELIKIMLVDSEKVVHRTYQFPDDPQFDNLVVEPTHVRLWIQSAVTQLLANKKMQLQTSIQEIAPELQDGFQTTISLSEEFVIKMVAVGN